MGQFSFGMPAFGISLPKCLKVFWQREFCIQKRWHSGILVWDPNSHL